MRSFEAPEIEGFRPVGATTILGVGYVTLRGANGITAMVSEFGVAAVDRSPELGALVGRVGDFMASRGTYGDVYAVREAEPLNSILRVANDGFDGFKAYQSSLYRPARMPESVIKTYDYSHDAAALQFVTLSALRKRLADCSDNVTAQQPYVMMRHRPGYAKYPATSIFEYIEGRTLDKAHDQWRLSGINPYEINEIARAADNVIIEALERALGPRWPLVANDLHGSNVIIEGPAPPRSVEEVRRHRFAVIDQPHASTLYRPIGKLVAGYTRFRSLLPTNRFAKRVKTAGATARPA